MMKRWDELTKEQQAKAVAKELNAVLTAVIEGAARFDDEANGNHIQALLEIAMEKACKMQTPWFAHEYIMDDVECAGALRGMAQAGAEMALYAEPGEYVTHGIIE